MMDRDAAAISGRARGRIAGFWRAPEILAAALLSCLPIASHAADPTQVYIESGTVGQGMLFRWRDTCFALTANHVLGSSDTATLVAGANAQVHGVGRVVTRFIDDDLALLRVSGTLALQGHCSTDLDELRADSDVLNRGDGSGSLAYVDREGQLLRIDILFKTPRRDQLLIEPRQAGDHLFRGRSGSLVYRGNRAAGILVRLYDGDSRQGVLVSMGQAVARIEAYFAKPAAATGSTLPPAFAVEDGNLLDPRLGAEAMEWSTLPAEPATGADQLLMRDGAQPWVARIDSDGRPVEVNFQLARAPQAQTIARVEIDAALSPPAGRWASEVEVLYSLTGEPGSWQTFGTTILLHQDEARKMFEAAPVRARFIKLRVYKNRGDPGLVSLARLRVYGPRRAVRETDAPP